VDVRGLGEGGGSVGRTLGGLESVEVAWWLGGLGSMV
jgi:hypothetical protein